MQRIRNMVPLDSFAIPPPNELFKIDHGVEEDANIFMIQKIVQGEFQASKK
jgi:hypothetical protein